MLFCKRITPVLLCLSAFTMQIVLASRCPESPLGVIRKYGQSCYEFISTKNNELFYQEAADRCKLNGGHLVTIKHKDVQVWLENTIAEDLKLDNQFWIGLVKRGSGWHWDTNNESNNQQNDESMNMVYSNWDRNEPDTTRNRQCVIFSQKTDFKWRAYPCEVFPHEYNYICQYDGNGGFFTKYENIFGFVAAVVGVVVLSIIAGYFVLKAHRKRKALMLQLSGTHRDYRRSNIEECSFLDSQQRNIDPEHCEVVTQPHFAPVSLEEDEYSLSNYNFNIIMGNNSSNSKPGLNKSIDMSPHRAASMVERNPNHVGISPVLRSKSNIEYGRNNNLERDTDEILFALQTIDAGDDSSESDAENADAVTLINQTPIIDKPMNVETPKHSVSTSNENLPLTPISNASTNNLSV